MGQNYFMKFLSSTGWAIRVSGELVCHGLSTFSSDTVTVQFTGRCALERGGTFTLIYNAFPGRPSIHFKWVEGALVYKEGNVCT